MAKHIQWESIALYSLPERVITVGSSILNKILVKWRGDHNNQTIISLCAGYIQMDDVVIL